MVGRHRLDPVLYDSSGRLRVKEATIRDMKARSRDDFSCSKVSGGNLDDADLHGLILRGSCFRYCSMQRCDFSGADLRGCRFRGADLRECNFSGADLRGAIMFYANVDSADFSGANLDGIKGLYLSTNINVNVKEEKTQ